MVPRFSFPFMHWLSSFFLTLLLSSCSRIDSFLYPMQLGHSSNTDSWRGETPLNTQYEVDVTRCCRTAQSELEQRAKEGHHKKSVLFYSCDDVWPSLFLQRDILIDISTGWRPLTSQSRGAFLNNLSKYLLLHKQIFNYSRCYHPKWIKSQPILLMVALKNHMPHSANQTVMTHRVLLHPARPQRTKMWIVHLPPCWLSTKSHMLYMLSGLHIPIHQNAPALLLTAPISESIVALRCLMHQSNLSKKSLWVPEFVSGKRVSSLSIKFSNDIQVQQYLHYDSNVPRARILGTLPTLPRGALFI